MKKKDIIITIENILHYNLYIKNYWFLYVLLLKNNFYYIGITLYPDKRIINHFEGNGANFTKKNKPIKIIELYRLNSIDRKFAYKIETLRTKEYRLIYGANKVIGGKYLKLATKN